MAPKLIPDNLAIPGGFVMALDRHSLDETVFPLGHHAGEIALTPNSHSKKYTPSQPIPSPYSDNRFITDIRKAARVDFRPGNIIYNAKPDGDGSVEIKHYLGQSAQPNRLQVESIINGTKDLISQVGENRGENPFPGDDIEIITLGTGS